MIKLPLIHGKPHLRPMDKPTDMMDIVLPDLVTVLPACSMSSGFRK